MGKKRNKKADEKLPKYCYLQKGRYIYKAYAGRENGKTKFKKEIRLCSADATMSQVWAAYEALMGTPQNTISSLFSKYFSSPKFNNLAPKTKKQYTAFAASLTKYPTKNKQPFGDADYTQITPGTIRRYLDKRDADGAPKSGNREISVLSAALSWAYNRDMLPRGTMNPCLGVERNRETADTRYVEDRHYYHAYNAAASAPQWYLQPMMEIAYLCRMRRIEILALTKSNILDQGLDTLRTKGSKDAITLWSTRLKNAINTAVKRPRKIRPMRDAEYYLFCDTYGKPIMDDSFTSAWDRFMTKTAAQAKQDGVDFERFKFHHLKAKGVSDFIGDKKRASGHKTDAMVAVYDRKKDEVDATR